MQPALSTRNRRLFNRRPSLLWKIRKVVQKYSIIIAFLPRHHKPQLLTPNRAAGCSQSKCPLGWDPAAAGSRAGDGMARFTCVGMPRCPVHTMQKRPFPRRERAFVTLFEQSESIRRAPELPSQQRRRGERRS